MRCDELLEILKRGEDTKHQFKQNFDSIDNLAAEISAFANTEGGLLIIGAGDSGDINGIFSQDITRLNQWISNATTNKIDPPIFVKTEVIVCDLKKLLVIEVPRGSNKPYAVNKTEFWVKNGADKRRASREELFRLLQSAGLLYADEMETDTTVEHLDMYFFREFYRETYNNELENLNIPIERLLENLRIIRDGQLTLSGLLIFGKNPEFVKPQFDIKGTYFIGNEISTSKYIDAEDFKGKLIDQFKSSISFVNRNLRKLQVGENFNDRGEIEIPYEAFSEAIANAIAHRDYFINTSIFINIFENRIEIVSPGLLPNTLDEEVVKLGYHIARNPTILSLLKKIKSFKYSGLGTGIPRMLEVCKKAGIEIELLNDKKRNQFRVTFFRPNIQVLKGVESKPKN